MIKKDVRNDLLKRREVEVVMTASSNPGLEEVKKFLSSELKIDVENLAIKSLKNNYGTNEFVIDALIYDSKEAMDFVEPRPKPKKGVA